jgi:hypothetical protein
VRVEAERARAFISAASNEELARFRAAIDDLLYGDESLPERIDASRDAGFTTLVVW